MRKDAVVSDFQTELNPSSCGNCSVYDGKDNQRRLRQFNMSAKGT